MNHRVMYGVVALVLGIGCVLGLFVWHRSQTARTCADQSPTPAVAVLGDSLVAGYGAQVGSDFVTVLGTHIGVPIKNWGVSGDTSAQGLARAKTRTDSPDIVLVLLGGNDALQKVPLEETRQNLSKIIELYQSKSIQVVLIGVIGGFPIDPYAPMFNELASTYHVTYVPNVLSGIFGNSTYMYDQVHPNAAGYARIAERLAPIVNGVCTKIPSKH